MSNVLELVNIRKSFGAELVLNDLSLTVPEHTATVLIGTMRTVHHSPIQQSLRTCQAVKPSHGFLKRRSLIR